MILKTAFNYCYTQYSVYNWSNSTCGIVDLHATIKENMKKNERRYKLGMKGGWLIKDREILIFITNQTGMLQIDTDIKSIEIANIN